MSIEIIFNSGSGSIEPDSLSEFSYAESVTPIQPSDSSGGASQVTFTANEIVPNKVGNTHPSSKLLINNDVTISDSLNGMISAKISKISIAGGRVSATADTSLSKLNVNVTAPPVHGTLLEALNAYCELAYTSPVFEDSFEEKAGLVNVSYPGWTGILWDKIKQLCASTILDGKPIEAVATADGITFRYAMQSQIEIDGIRADYSLEIDSFDAAKSIAIPRTFTEYATNKVIYEMANYDQGVDPDAVFKASINDSLQVEAGATIKKRFAINATPESVNQPVCVSTIDRTPPAPYAGTTGQYVVVGNDNLPLVPAQWIAFGGDLRVDLTDVPGEIEITIVAPPLSEIEKEAGGTGLAPYSIGIESSGEGDYPALWITGTGVFYHDEQRELPTGSDPDNSNADAASVEAGFLTSENEYWTKAVLAAQKACGPSVTATIQAPANIPYGTGIGANFYRDSNRFRITEANYSVAEATLSAVACATFADFNPIWTDLTFEDFTSVALDPNDYPDQAMQFNEFTIIPLMEAQ